MHLCNCLNSRRLNNASLNNMHPSPCCSRLSVDVCSLMYSGQYLQNVGATYHTNTQAENVWVATRSF